MRCPKCGSELLKESRFCSNCGTKLQETTAENVVVDNETNAKSVASEENNERTAIFKKNIHSLIKDHKYKIIGILTLIIISVISFTIYSMPSVQYSRAEKAFANQKYSKAVKGYTAAGDYKDAAAKLKEAKVLEGYTSGKQEFENGNYETALEKLIIAKEYKDSKEMLIKIGEELTKNGDFVNAVKAFDNTNSKNNSYSAYANGMLAVSETDYKKAVDFFEKAENILDSKEQLYEASYTYAKEQFQSKKYDIAGEYFQKADSFKDAKNLQNASFLLFAYDCMGDGKLIQAKTSLEKVSSGYTYNGINRDNLWNKLTKNADWVNLTGKWYSISGSAVTNCKSRDLWYDGGSWSNEIGNGDYTLDITCIINDDNTITIAGKGDIMIFTNWSTIQLGLRYDMNHNISFKKTIPSSKYHEPIWIDNNTSLKFGTDQINLNYTYDDLNSTTNFIYKYTTNITYGNKAVN